MSTKNTRYLIFEDGGTIHGVIQTAAEFLIVFGGCQLAILNRDKFQRIRINDNQPQQEPLAQQLEVSNCLTCPTNTTSLKVSDWIWDARLKQTENSDSTKAWSMALGLANNNCEIWSIQSDGELSTVVQVYRQHRFFNHIRCITYCMALHGWDKSMETLLLASGTVNHQILLWKVETTDTPLTDRPVAIKLEGHEGVILSLKFNHNASLLVSTSDDRSVRLWNIQAKTCVMSELRGDGCGGDQGTLLWVGWGHTARVWNAVFTTSSLPGTIVSTGEDGTARLWDVCNGKELGLFKNYASHSLWCVDVSGSCAVVGTNDGSIKFWDLQRFQQLHGTFMDTPVEARLLVPDDRLSLPTVQGKTDEAIVASDGSSQMCKTRKKIKTKHFAQVVVGMDFFQTDESCDCLAIATRSGALLILTLTNQVWHEPQEWLGEAERRLVNSYEGSCLSISSRQTLAVGTSKGAMIFKDLCKGACCAILDGTVHKNVQSLVWLQANQLASFHIKGIIALWIFSQDPIGAQKTAVLNTTTSEIPTCIVSCGEHGYVAGDSRGNLVLFHLDPKIISSNEEVAAVDVCRRVHAKEHVNDIACLENNRVLSVGNDGCLRECALVMGGCKLMLGPLIPILGLSGVSKIWNSTERNFQSPLFVSGYFGNIFRIINFTDGNEIVSIDTGGRQRLLSHVVSMASNQIPNCGVAICASRKEGQNDLILYSTLHTTKCKLLLSGYGVALHGEPVYGVFLFSTRDQCAYTALLSCSEDCSVKLTFLDKNGVLYAMTLPSQESCVRAVTACRHPGSATTLLVVCGGKLIVDFYFVHDSNTASFSPGHIFVREVGRGHINEKADIDHRINAVSALPIDMSSHLVMTGDSNGNVNCFIVDEACGKMRSPVRGTLLITVSLPILSLDMLFFGDRYLAFVGTTSGEMSVWLVDTNLSTAAMSLGVHQAHQMGTNRICARVRKHEDNVIQVLIASVGDDQALTVAEVEISLCPLRYEIISEFTTKEACVSALKGCHFINENMLVIVGYGQRLAIWQWSRAFGNKMVASVPIDVYDVNSLAYCNGTVVVGGEGVEIVRVVGL